jgi:hypothetical protein
MFIEIINIAMAITSALVFGFIIVYILCYIRDQSKGTKNEDDKPSEERDCNADSS